MKIYEVTSRVPNEQQINQELRKLYEAAAAPPAGSVEPSPGIFSRAGSMIAGAIKAAGLFFLLKPFYTLYKNWSTADDNLKKTGDQATYNQIMDVQIGLFLTSFAAALATKAIFGTAGLFVSFIRFIPVVGPIIARLFGLLSSGIQVAILAELSSEEGRTNIAKLFTWKLINGEAVNGVAAIGHLGHEGINYIADLIERQIKSATGQQTDTPKTQDNADKPTNAATDKPADNNPSFMADLFGANDPAAPKEEPLPNEYLGPKLQRNPVTGKVEMKASASK